MDYKHIIWDWNGTLLNDWWLCIESINKTLQKRELSEINDEKYLELFCFPVESYYKKLGFDFAQEPFAILGTKFINNYNTKFTEPNLQKGARQILKFVKSKNLTQSILSAGKQEYVDDWIDFHQLEDYFINILGINDHFASSKEKIGIKWMTEMDYNWDEVLMIGDTLHDAAVAAVLEVKCILVAHGHNSHSRLQTSGNRVFSNLHQIQNWL